MWVHAPFRQVESPESWATRKERDPRGSRLAIPFTSGGSSIRVDTGLWLPARFARSRMADGCGRAEEEHAVVVRG